MEKLRPMGFKVIDRQGIDLEMLLIMLRLLRQNSGQRMPGRIEVGNQIRKLLFLSIYGYYF